jgi:small subunit ribosomal protein S20
LSWARRIQTTALRFDPTVAKTPRTWTGARTPSGLKRVRASKRRHAILAPRRTEAKTLVKRALVAAAAPSGSVDPQAALEEAVSALDRAAKAGAIHPNAAARRKSRLARKINAALGGATVKTAAREKKTGGAAQAKAAKSRIAASKATKAKGAQTAAGKARAALARTTRAEAAAAAEAPADEQPTAAPARKAPSRTTSRAKAPTAKAAAEKPAPKATARKTTKKSE